MSSESVSILIAADDKASAKLKAVGNQVDALGARVKETGGKLKAGSELAGVFANAFGGSAIGAFSSELGQLTEKVSAFSEVSKSGAGGALAFKAALAGAVAIASYKVGAAIGNWWFETNRWKEELKAAATEAERLEKLRMDKQQKRFSQNREEMGLIFDPAEREAATNAEADRLAKEAEGMKMRIKLAEEEVKARKAAEAWSIPGGNATAEREIAEQQLAQLKEQQAALRAESEALKESVGERAKRIESLKAENEAKAKSGSFVEGLEREIELLKATKEEQRAIEAQRNAPAQSERAKQLLEERDALLAKKAAESEAEAAAKQAAKERESEAQRIEQLEKRELARLQAKRIELEQGKEAARAFMLEQEGLSKDSAARIAREEAALTGPSIGGSDGGPQQALQGRLLTRGIGGGDPFDRAAAAAEKQVAKLETLNANLGGKLDKLYEAQKSKSIVLKSVNVP